MVPQEQHYYQVQQLIYLAYQGFPRRVAFVRDLTNNKLTLDSNKRPVPIGIDTGNKINCFSTAALNVNSQACSTGVPPTTANALLFQTRNGSNRSCTLNILSGTFLSILQKQE